MRRFAIVGLMAALSACGPSDYERFTADYKLGFQDGYGATYVNTCKGGQFSVSKGNAGPGYDDGYREGEKQARLECKWEEG